MLRKILSLVVTGVMVMGVMILSTQPALAKKECGEGQVSTSILGSEGCKDVDGDTIGDLVKLVARIVVYGLGAAAVLGTVIAGILYLTARDNESQAAVARRRLFEIAIGLVAWAVMFALLNWLIPGGLTW